MARSAPTVAAVRTGRACPAPTYPAIMATLLALATAGAQQPPRQDATVPKFTTNPTLVLETVSVTDKSGKPMEGLKAEDFAVTEDKVPQTIRLFEFQKLDDVPLADLERRTEPAAPAPPTPSAVPAAVGAPLR